MLTSFYRRPILAAVLICTFFSNVTAQQQTIIDSIPVKEQRIFLKKFAVPAALTVLGTCGSLTNWGINQSVRNERNKHYPNFHHKADNYLQYAPIPVVFAMDAFGLKAKHNWKQQSVLLVTSEVFMNAMVQSLKRVTHKMRPDSSADNSFPSGHTAQAFLAASFFNKEFGGRYPWLSAGMYTVATGVGVFRILNNKHWVSDVLSGAGFGILSVELAYLFEKKIKKNIARHIPYVMPSYQDGRFLCTAFFRL